MKQVLIAVILVGGIAAPAHAQIEVNDVLAIAKAAIMVEVAGQTYETVQKTYAQWQAINAALEGMDRYNIPQIAMGQHDPLRYPGGAPFLQALNAGDPRGALYAKVIAALPAARAVAASLPPGPAKDTIDRQLAAIEISDSIIERGAHQVGAIRTYSPSLLKAIGNLTADVTNARRAYHYPGARLDMISGAEVIGRNQDMATNQLTSHILEQLLNEAKAQRDADADTMNLRLGDVQNGSAAAAAMVAGSGAQIRAWRQP
jgi:hypothetical protein